MEKFAHNFCREKLNMAYTGIGSLPFAGENAPEDALNYVFNYCKNFPFWPQLPHFKMEENMACQFLDNLLDTDYNKKNHKFYFNNKDKKFIENSKNILHDYESIISGYSIFEYENILDKYKIKIPYSNTIAGFLKEIQNSNNKPDFIKGTITGPFTLSTSLYDHNNKFIYYNEATREIITKLLVFKALWQIKEFKKVSSSCTPIIFMDEPSLSKLNSPLCVDIKKEDIIKILKTVSNAIQKFGAIAGVHCCGETDWDMIIKSGVCILNFDAYFYTENLCLYSKQVETFLKKGGFLAFGIIPTTSIEELSNLDINKLYKKFQNSINMLSKYIDKNLILNQCFITPACGCGSLSSDLARKVLILAEALTKKLPEIIKKKNEAIT